ncbi:C-GCAxxG-C-C family (seleno)protein [Humidesulfovibrio idahonensis]
MSSREYFAKVAEQWDALRSGFFPESVREKALALAGIGAGNGPGLTAADLGAGAGFVTQALLGAGLAVFAVDQSPEMLAELRKRFGAAGRLTVLEGEAGRLPLPDASVDFVFANMFLHHVDDPQGAIAEMARILRPGGRLVITDLDSHSHGFLLTEHHDRWPGFARADVSAWLQRAGLADAAVDCCGENCCADACDGSDSARISIFAASARRPVLGVRLADADPDAVAGYAREFWSNARPLLCAESVLSAVARGLGVRSPLIPRMATGFCSGLSRCCGPCGAFSAGVMALGMALGRDSGRDDLDETYSPVQEFREFFLERYGALECRTLIGHDLGTHEGHMAYREAGLKTTFCAPLLEETAAQVIRILKEQQR